MPKKILVFYTSIGLGHKSIAENIGYWLSKSGFEVELKDAHEVQGGILASWGAAVHGFILRNVPFVWAWFHNTEWFITLTLPIRTWVAGFNYNHVLKLIQESNPDLVISSHNTSSALVSYLKKRGLYTGVFGVTFSDYFLHRYWLFENVDFYLANTEEQKQQMVRLGISADKITVCGMTLKEKQEVDVTAVRGRLGVPSENKVVLFSSGSQGIGLRRDLLKQLSSLNHTTVLVVCGKDKVFFEDIEKDFVETNVKPLGYYTPMDELYAISDVFVTKPGGLTVAEALRWHLPLLIFYVLPGGEPLNFDYLLERGMVLKPEPTVLQVVQQELATGEAKLALQRNLNLAKLYPDPQVLVGAVRTGLETKNPMEIA